MLLLSKPGHIILYACCCHFLILEFRDYGEETTRYWIWNFWFNLSTGWARRIECIVAIVPKWISLLGDHTIWSWHKSTIKKNCDILILLFFKVVLDECQTQRVQRIILLFRFFLRYDIYIYIVLLYLEHDVRYDVYLTE